MKIAICADVGESFGRYKLGSDEELIPLISSANVACGWHAGDPMIMRNTVRLAKRHGVAIGPHPGFPDLLGFGRRPMEVSPEEFKNYVIYQIGALMAIAKSEGVKLQHITPHGAAGHMCERPEFAKAFVDSVMEVDPTLVIPFLYGPEGEAFFEEANKRGARVITLFLADRGYTKDGHVADRKLPGAVLHNSADVLARVIRMVKEQKVRTMEGEDIRVTSPCILIHGDTDNAVENAQTLRKGLQAEGIKLVPVAELL